MVEPELEAVLACDSEVMVGDLEDPAGDLEVPAGDSVVLAGDSYMCSSSGMWEYGSSSCVSQLTTACRMQQKQHKECWCTVASAYPGGCRPHTLLPWVADVRLTSRAMLKESKENKRAGKRLC